MKPHVALLNSNPRQPAGSKLLQQKQDPAEILHVTIVLRVDPKARGHRNAAQSDVALVEQFAKEHKLKVVESSLAKRSVLLSGTASQISAAFAATLTLHDHGGLQYRSHEGPVQIPGDLKQSVVSVLGLDNRALMKPDAFLKAKSSSTESHVTAAEVASAYNFPDSTGKSQRIAIIVLGGGFHKSDITKYFQKAGIAEPKVTVVEIGGQKNNPASPALIEQMLEAMGQDPIDETKSASKLDPADAVHALWTIEATMDLQLAGSFAPDAELIIYFAPNNAQGKYQALTSALHNAQHSPTVMTCSWGAAEEGLPVDFVHALDEVFQDAAQMGVTICFSSGDRGEDNGTNGQPRVHFPASSPHVLSCGGSHWKTPKSRKKEAVWSEQLPTTLAQSGGGTSGVFAEPAWQKPADVKARTGKSGRGVPDVSGKADMEGGYQMIVGGFQVTMGGTSAAAPMWSGLVARINEELGKNAGYITPLLYQESFRDAFHDITKGKTGKRFKAAPGWDPCTGWGTPDGKKLLTALKS